MLRFEAIQPAAQDMEDVLRLASQRQPRRYLTHVAKAGGHLYALWEGDEGYDDRDATRGGPRHRLRMGPDEWTFECTAEGWGS